VTIGPAIEDGFYYDFARETPFTPDDLPIEADARSWPRFPTCAGLERDDAGILGSAKIQSRNHPHLPAAKNPSTITATGTTSAAARI
jgi:hypothetical protein